MDPESRELQAITRGTDPFGAPIQGAALGLVGAGAGANCESASAIASPMVRSYA